MTLCIVLLGVSTGWAQKQERSLVDRLLRPNMELQNDAQNKKFTKAPAVVERRGTVGTFYLQTNRAEKSFSDRRNYSTSEYSGNAFYSGSRAIASNQNQSANAAASLGASTVRDVHETSDGHRQVAGRNFADEPSFREEGKSQKSLDRQNPPLTIDQVRELLNKNK